MILRTVGQGGMGAVYQARDMKRQVICAIKEMSLSMVPLNERPQAIQNFKIEAKMLWGLNHANLPAFHGFFTEGPRYFMVMEYVDGYTLEDLLERNAAPFPERRVLSWARQLCDVLEYLHTQNPPIIFRDMKPGNIMLMRNGRIKLIDFGIARFFRSTLSSDTQLLGTPGFAPPEQYGKAQTDERSDIYSLAMTLFQLLTNTLSETGFGIKDMRSINPLVSPIVARSLEKAAALSPDDRYDNVAAFRRALLGVGTFMFENEDQATTPEELADLCARYPEEASDYLASGEIESWFREIGEAELARATRNIRTTVSDPMAAVEQFLQTVMGPNARIRNFTSTSANGSSKNGNNGSVSTIASSRNDNDRSLLSTWFGRKQTSPIHIAPPVLDFGQVYPGITAPLTFTITGDQGISIKGTIHTDEPWLIVDQAQFDAMTTRVNVRVNSTRLPSSTHHTGSIIVTLEDVEDEKQQDLLVSVEVDVLGLSNTPARKRGGKTVGADLDDDEDEDDDDVLVISGNGMTMVSPSASTQVATGGFASLDAQRDSEYKRKYGQPGMNGTQASHGWDPLHASPLQRLWMQRSFTFLAAFMAASLCYTIVAAFPLLAHALPLPPNPWFIVVLACMVPLATAGALLVNRDSSWTLKDTIDRACTGMGSALAVLALAKIFWLIAIHANFAVAQLLIMLTIVALGATLGTYPYISDYIIHGVLWSLTHMRIFGISLAVILGGVMGFFLTSGIAFGWLTPFGVVAGVGVAIALVLRMDQRRKHSLPQNQTSVP